MSAEQHKIIFTPSGLSASTEAGTTVLAAAFDSGVQIRSLCGGNGNCRQCWVRVIEGKHTKHGIDVGPDSVSELTEIEERMTSRIKRFAGMRLACRTQVCGDLLIDVPEASQEHLTSISKSNAARDFSVQATIKLYDIQLAEATMDDNPSASENLIERLAEQNVHATVNFRLLRDLQPIVDEHKGALTVAVRDGSEVVAVYPSGVQRVLGGAVDIGSTTLALYVHDLTTGELLFESSAMNPQIRFGEDLMSRVSYVMMNKGGDVDMTSAVRQKLTEMVLDACKKLELPLDRLLEMVLVGNPIMHHLFFGISPVPLGQAPFTVTARDWMDVERH